MTSRRTLLIALGAASACALPAGGVLAQGYPARPVTLVYPYPAGSTTDGAWRLIAQEMSKVLGQSVVVENRAGASGRIGFDAVRRSSDREGYTLGVMNNTLAVLLPLMDASFQAESRKDYVPIGLAIETYAVLVAHPAAPFKDLPGLIQHARAQPGALNIGSAGTGTPSHLAGELLQKAAGIQLTHVPYKGEGPAITDLLAGRLHLYFGVGILKPHVDAGRLVGIATTGPQRWQTFPGLPTFREAGLNFNTSSWLGLIGPPGLASGTVATLSRALATVLGDASLRSRLEEQGWAIFQNSRPEDFERLVGSDIERWRPVIAGARITVTQ